MLQTNIVSASITSSSKEHVMRRLITCVAVAFATLAVSASAVANVTNVALTSTVINVSSIYPAPAYEVGNVIDGQDVVGNPLGITAADTADGSSYWLGFDSESDFFVLDLGASYSINQLRIANTRNYIFGDFTTQTFDVFASNSIDGGNNLTSPTTLISDGSLTQPLDPAAIPFDVFNPVGDSFGTYRYIEFEGFRSTPGHIGLNEFEVINTPEPASLCLLMLGSGMLLRRRRHRA